MQGLPNTLASLSQAVNPKLDINAIRSISVALKKADEYNTLGIDYAAAVWNSYIDVQTKNCSDSAED